MYTLLVIIHSFVSLVLIMVVLLQSGKGASMGAAFGGGGQTMFGARGQTTGIQKMTVGAAVLFMVPSPTVKVAKAPAPASSESLTLKPIPWMASPICSVAFNALPGARTTGASFIGCPFILKLKAGNVVLPSLTVIVKLVVSPSSLSR